MDKKQRDEILQKGRNAAADARRKKAKAKG
jgi:hypothetical protein